MRVLSGFIFFALLFMCMAVASPAEAQPAFDLSTGILFIPYVHVPGVGTFQVTFVFIGGVFHLQDLVAVNMPSGIALATFDPSTGILLIPGVILSNGTMFFPPTGFTLQVLAGTDPLQFLFTAMQGPQGPRGPEGPQGPPGPDGQDACPEDLDGECRDFFAFTLSVPAE